MSPDLVRSLGSVPEPAIWRELGWDAFFRYKLACYLRSPEEFCHRIGHLEFLGMTPGEYADWKVSGAVSDRLKRMWSEQAPTTTEETK